MIFEAFRDFCHQFKFMTISKRVQSQALIWDQPKVEYRVANVTLFRVDILKCRNVYHRQLPLRVHLFTNRGPRTRLFLILTVSVFFDIHSHMFVITKP